MHNYYIIFDAFGSLNSIMLFLGSWLSLSYLRSKSSSILSFIAFYVLIAFVFDSISRLTTSNLFKMYFDTNVSAYLRIIYRLVELILVGYLFNKFWLQNKIVWVLIGISSIYLVYDLINLKSLGILNYDATAITFANTLLLILGVFAMIKSLFYVKDVKLNNQLLCMIFVAYFAIHLIYTVIHNFLINQTFSDKSFAIFYSSYAILHLIFYSALSVIIYRNYRNKQIKNL